MSRWIQGRGWRDSAMSWRGLVMNTWHNLGALFLLPLWLLSAVLGLKRILQRGINSIYSLTVVPLCCHSSASLFTVGQYQKTSSKNTNPIKGTATPVSGYLTHVELNSTPSNRIRYPWRSTFISGQICPPCVYNPRHRGWPQSPLPNQLHDHTSSKAVPRGADTAEARRPEHAWTHGAG